MAKPRQRQDRDAEHAQGCAIIFDALFLGVEKYAGGGHFPTGLFRAAFAILDRAARIGHLIERHVALGITRAAFGGQSATGTQYDEQVFNGARFEGVGQFDLVGIDDVAIHIDKADVAGGHDLAGLAIPHHIIGAHCLIDMAQHDAAISGDQFLFAVIAHFIGFEPDKVLRS